MEDATRLASQGHYRCKLCQKVDRQERGVVVAFAGNILLALCPACLHRPIVISREGGAIKVELQGAAPHNLHTASSMREVEGMILAKPGVKKVEY